jgi:transcription antitermination protein NusB
VTAKADAHAAERDGRRLALSALFEADFGQHTALSALEREIAQEATAADGAALARQIVSSVVAQRDTIDTQIEQLAPQYPVVSLARIDRALLRSAIAELLHCATPARVTIAEWVELARTYSGEPARKLVNGVLGRVAQPAAERGRDVPASGKTTETGTDRHTGGSPNGRLDI